jgi:hypothetical protein
MAKSPMKPKGKPFPGAAPFKKGGGKGGKKGKGKGGY